MANKTISWVLTARDESSSAFSSFDRRLQTLNGQADRSTRSLTTLSGGVSKVASSMSGAERSTSSATTAFSRQEQSTRTLSSSNSALADSWTKVGSGAATVGRSLATVSTAMAAIAVISIKTAGEFESTLNTMAAVAGVPGPELEKLSDLAKKMGADTVFSANEAADAMLELAKAGVSTADIMGGGLQATLNLAAAGGLELANAATISGNAMNTFGLEGNQASMVADALAGAANASSANVSDLAIALSQGGLAANAARLSIQETTAVLGAFADAGLRGSDAGTSLKTFLLNLVPNTDKARGAMADLGLKFTDLRGQMLPIADISEQLRVKTAGLSDETRTLALQTIFGTDAYRAALVLSKLGAEGLRDYTEATSQAGAAATVAEARMKGWAGTWETFRGSLETAGLTIGQTLIPVVSAILQAFTGLINMFISLPGPAKLVIEVFAGLVFIVTTLGAAFLLLAPKINAATEVMGKLATRAPATATALRTIGAAAGWIGLALTAGTIVMGLYAKEQQKTKEVVDSFVDALEKEASGIKGAADAAIEAKLVQGGLVTQATQLGIEYESLAEAIKGNAEAMDAVGISGQKIIGTIGNQSGAMAGLGSKTDIAKAASNEFRGSLSGLADAFEKAKVKAAQQEAQTNQLIQVTGKSKKELVDLGLATATVGDKIGDVAGEIGLTSEAMKKLGITSEAAAKDFAKSVSSVMEATQKAFEKDFNAIGKFSTSGWEKMQKDAESSLGAIGTAEENLADARQNLADVQERLNAKTTRSVTDNQQLAKAQDKVTEATKALSEAQDKGSQKLGTLSEEIAKFYKDSAKEATDFTTGISKAIEMGLDPSAVSRLLQQGPKESAAIIEEIVGDHGNTLVKIMNEGEAALAKTSTLAVEIARLTQLAVASKSGQMVQDLKTAMKLAQTEAAAGGKATIGELAAGMNLEYGQVKRILDEFGIVYPAEVGTAAALGSAAFKEQISKIPLTAQEQADLASGNWKAGLSPMALDTRAAMMAVDTGFRGGINPLPGFTQETADKLATFWRVGLDPMPGNTDTRAKSTADLLRSALNPLPNDSKITAEATVTNWLRELSKGENGTTEQTVKWAEALLGILNPILQGVGADLISPSAYAAASRDSGDITKGWAMGGRVDATPGGKVPGTGNGDIIPAWLEPDEFVIRKRAVKAFGIGNLERINNMAFAEGGLVPPPDLSDFGTMVGHTANMANNQAYEAALAFVAEQERKKAAAVAMGGSPYTGGDIGSGWQQITGYLDSKGIDYTVTSTTGGGHVEGSLHYQGKAVDLVGDMGSIFGTLAAGNPVPGINELFYDPAGFYFDEGNRVDGAIGGHEDHVHAATFGKGGRVPSFERGVAEVPFDMLAYLHAKEMVMPAGVAEEIRQLLPGSGGAGVDTAELSSLVAEVRAMAESIGAAEFPVVLAADDRVLGQVVVKLSREYKRSHGGVG